MPFRLRPSTVIAFVILLGCGYYFYGVFLPLLQPGLVARNLASGYGYSNDFYPIWIGSRELFHGRNPYAPELTPKIETGLYGRPLNRLNRADDQINYRAFTYPLYTIFLLSPFAALPFPTVQVVLTALLPILAALTVTLWLRILGTGLSPSGTFTTICLTLASYPVLEGVYAGQPSLISTFLIAGAIAAVAQERLVLAGILLPCASIKPQLVLLIALWLIGWAVCDWTQRRNFVIAFAATTALLLAASTWALPSWFGGWMLTLREYRRISPPPLAQFVLGGLAGNLITLFLLALSLRLCWRVRLSPATSARFQLATTFILATTAIVLSSSIAIYDQFLLLPGVLFLYTRYDRILRASISVRVLTLVALGALGWQWVAACALVLAHWVWPAQVHDYRLLFLPLRTEASVPFAFMALLCFVALQEIRSQAGSALADHPAQS